jgi:uroporphyrinogen III methyltransferase / synthase
MKDNQNNKPLAGHLILVTRSDISGYRRLEDLGAALYSYPTIRTVPPEDYSGLDASIETVKTYHWIVFTSANGVMSFMSRLAEKGKGPAALEGLKICAIGPKTAEAAAGYKLDVTLMPDEFNADGLITAFIQYAKSIQDARYKTSNLEGLRILLPRAENAGDTFPDRITELGGEIDCPTAYCSENPAGYDAELYGLLKAGKITVATFTSAATFHNFVEAMGDEAVDLLRTANIAVLGTVTARAVEAAGLKTAIIPEKATIESLVDEIARFATGMQ